MHLQIWWSPPGFIIVKWKYIYTLANVRLTAPFPISSGVFFVSWWVVSRSDALASALMVKSAG